MSDVRQMAQKLVERHTLSDGSYDFDAFGAAYLSFLKSCHEHQFGLQETGELIPQMPIDLVIRLLGKDFTQGLNNCGKHLEVAETPGVGEGTAAWLVEAQDRTRADPVIVFCHGGGYLNGLYPFYYRMWKKLYQEAGSPRVSILFVDYTRDTEEKYPYQLNELSMILNTLGQSSSNVVLAGDSAGAHLCLGVLKHASSPVESVAEVKMPTLPQSLLLVSPWVNISPTEEEGGSYITNKGPGSPDASDFYQYGEFFAPDKFTSEELNPCKDHTTRWSELINRDKSLVYYGAAEVMADDIYNWSTQAAGLAAQRVFGDVGAPHGFSLMFDPDGRQEAWKAVVGWMEAICE